MKPITLLSHPYHRGGVTRWMVDFAIAYARRGGTAWFACPRPRKPFLSGGSQPPLTVVLDATPGSPAVRRAHRDVTTAYELGTESYRAGVLGDLVREHVPEESVIVLSDDPSVWRAGRDLTDSYSVIGVLHADDLHYYELAARYGAAMSALVCVSGRVRRTLQRRAVIPDERIFQIPCGTPLPPVHARSTASRPWRLIWAGRIEERQKRVSDLPRIMLELQRRGVPVVLDIVGDGPDRAALERMLEAAHLESTAVMHGWCDAPTVQSLMGAADVLLLPSNFEGMPVAVMEALAMGCGVVGTHVSGLEDFADHPDAMASYRTYPPGDVQAGAAAILGLLEIPAGVRGAHARRLAESEFSIEQCVARYAAIPPAPGASRPMTDSRWKETLATYASFPLAALRFARWRVRQLTRTTAPSR